MCWFWQKNNNFSLLLFFSYDLRGRGPEKARHWSDDHVLGKSRAMFFMAPPPVSSSQESLLSVLKIRGIRDSDRGLYRCRVDFKAAPTRNTRANLTVIGNCSTNDNGRHLFSDSDKKKKIALFYVQECSLKNVL